MSYCWIATNNTVVIYQAADVDEIEKIQERNGKTNPNLNPRLRHANPTNVQGNLTT